MIGVNVCLLVSVDLLFSGSRPSVGETGNDVESPLALNLNVYDASAGSDYTIFVLDDRSASVAGIINNVLNGYKGHFAIDRNNLSDGVNARQTITEVVDLGGNLIPAPKFWKVYAGVESSSGSGEMHSVFIDMNGNIYASGYNSFGQLCLGDEASREFANQISLPSNERAVAAAVGIEFTLIVTANGKLYGCGRNNFGQLGLGDAVSARNTPDNANSLSGVESVLVGHSFSFVGTSSGLYVMGRNNYGTFLEGLCEKWYRSVSFSFVLT